MVATSRWTHVIFDCDGVLVDSESLSAGVLMEMMAEINLPINDEIFRLDFLGRSFANASARAEQRFGKPMPADFQMRYRTRLLQKMRNSLQSMPGAPELLASMRIPYCLATSSSPQRLEVSLRAAGLDRFFSSNMFTASEVKHGKPAPDLFLHAASKMEVKPSRCLVIEDSEMGVRAAQNAEMTVWHFAGGSHIKAGYRLPDDAKADAVISDMVELQVEFRKLGLCH